jgi:hypothetical protein
VNTHTPAPGRFEDRLLTAILADFDQLTGTVAGPRQGRRRAARPALAAGAVAVVMAVALTVTGIAGLSGRHASVPARPAGPVPVPVPVRLQTAAYVLGHLRSALGASTAVVDIVDHAPDSQTGRPVTDEIWSSTLSRTYRIEDLTPAGRPVTGYLVTITAHRTVSIVVNYRARTWTRTVYPFGSASSRRRPGVRGGSPAQQAAQLRAEVTAGKVTMAGRGTVDGQRAIHLIQRSADGLLSMWVSPATYLPIRVIGTAPGEPANSPQAIRDDYRWLPGSPANLRLLTPAAAIPAGFTQVGAGHAG